MPVLIYEKDSCVVISREGLNIAIYQCGGTEICYHVGHECEFSEGNIVGLIAGLGGLINCPSQCDRLREACVHVFSCLLSLLAALAGSIE